MDGLAAIPLQKVGDAGLVTAVLKLRGAMGRIKKHLDEASIDDARWPDLGPVPNERTIVSDALASILQIAARV
jgi:hypothetical protein